MDNKFEGPWGVWDDCGPFYVKADGKTLEQAKKELLGYLEYTDYNNILLPLHEGKPIKHTVWDCEFDGPFPCSNPNCAHDHEEMVYVFEEVEPARKGKEG